eukprot:scaffold304073_cov30-Tisochrysis_lutea.AAC.4
MVEYRRSNLIRPHSHSSSSQKPAVLKQSLFTRLVVLEEVQVNRWSRLTRHDLGTQQHSMPSRTLGINGRVAAQVAPGVAVGTTAVAVWRESKERGKLGAPALV